MVSVVAILGVCCEKIFANFAELCGGEFSELSALWHSRSLLWFIVVVCGLFVFEGVVGGAY